MSRVMMVVVAGLALVLTGCGAAAGTGGGAAVSSGTVGPPVQRSLPGTPTPTAPATPVGNVLTAADSGATVTLVTGQRLTVDLAPGVSAYAWDRPRLTGLALRLVSVTGGYPSRAPMRAIYLAIMPGTAVLSSASDMPCLHAHPQCLVAQRDWTARVIVRSES